MNKLKQLKGKKESFPCLLGIKDLDRPNVYQELIGGMKDLCPVLFNHNEVLKLFLSSLPFKKSPKENVVQDRVVLKCKTTQGKAIVSIAREENHKEENIEEYLIDTSLIKRQFEWLDGML